MYLINLVNLTTLDLKKKNPANFWILNLVHLRVQKNAAIAMSQ